MVLFLFHVLVFDLVEVPSGIFFERPFERSGKLRYLVGVFRVHPFEGFLRERHGRRDSFVYGVEEGKYEKPYHYSPVEHLRDEYGIHVRNIT